MTRKLGKSWGTAALQTPCPLLNGQAHYETLNVVEGNVFDEDLFLCSLAAFSTLDVRVLVSPLPVTLSRCVCMFPDRLLPLKPAHLLLIYLQSSHLHSLLHNCLVQIFLVVQVSGFQPPPPPLFILRLTQPSNSLEVPACLSPSATRNPASPQQPSPQQGITYNYCCSPLLMSALRMRVCH